MRTDEQLYAAIRRGEGSAFDRLYERYERPLYHFLLRYTQDEQQAQDIFHEVFLRLIQGKTLQFENTRLRSWLYTVARNLALNYLKQKKRHSQLLAVHEVGSLDAGQEVQLSKKQTWWDLKRRVDSFPRALRRVFELRQQGLPYLEIAKELNIPLGTVKSRMHVVLSELKRGK